MVDKDIPVCNTRENFGAVSTEFAVRVALAVRCRGIIATERTEEGRRHFRDKAAALLSNKKISEAVDLVDCFNSVCQDFRIDYEVVYRLKKKIFKEEE